MRLEPIRQCKLVYNCLKMVFKIMTRPKNTEMGFESCFPPRLCNTATYGCLLTLRGCTCDYEGKTDKGSKAEGLCKPHG